MANQREAKRMVSDLKAKAQENNMKKQIDLVKHELCVLNEEKLQLEKGLEALESNAARLDEEKEDIRWNASLMLTYAPGEIKIDHSSGRMVRTKQIQLGVQRCYTWLIEISEGEVPASGMSEDRDGSTIRTRKERSGNGSVWSFVRAPFSAVGRMFIGPMAGTPFVNAEMAASNAITENDAPAGTSMDEDGAASIEGNAHSQHEPNSVTAANSMASHVEAKQDQRHSGTQKPAPKIRSSSGELSEGQHLSSSSVTRPQPRAPTEPRAHRIASGVDNSGAGQKRKRTDAQVPKCVHCWINFFDCDGGPSCGSCIKNGKICTRKLCDSGSQCTHTACPRLHPSQYDQRSGDWNTEYGRLPPGRGSKKRKAGASS